MNARRWMVPLLVLFALGLAALGHSFLWRQAMQRLERGLTAFTLARQAQGWTVGHGAPIRGGWPLAARLTMPELAIDTGDGDTPRLAWRADRLVLRLDLLRPRSLVLLPQGRQTLRLASSADIPFTADALSILLPMAAGIPPAEATLRIENLRAGLPSGGLTAAALSLRAEWKLAASQGEPGLSLGLEATGILLPPAETGWSLGARIARLELDAALTGPWPKLGRLADRAVHWRDGGGTLLLRRLLLAWGPLQLGGSATIALDDQLQPMGAASLRAVGYAATLDALVAAGLLEREAAGAVGAGLAGIATLPEDGGGPIVEAAATVQRGEAAIGRLRLGRIPALPWPERP